MKILLLSDIQEHGVKCADGLIKLGHEVLYAYPKDMISRCVSLPPGVEGFELPYGGMKGYFLDSFSLRKLWKRYKPDVVFVHYASGFGLLSRLSCIHPVALSCYGSDIFEFPRLNKINYLLLRDILKHADCLQSTSYAMAEEVRSILGKPENPVDIIPFGVNVNVFRRTHNKRHNRPVIGFIKSLYQIYDVPLLINAFSICYKQLEKKPELRIYGDGPLKGDLEILAKQLGVDADVHFMGRVSNDSIPEVLSEMDILINSSYQESFGVNILEAMACEVPVIATDCVGPKEIMLDGETGIILKDRNPETMAASMINLLGDDILRESMGKAGRIRVLDKYDWNKNVLSLEQSLLSIIKQ